MLANERWSIIFQTLQENGYVEVIDLASRLNTSVATVRRDLSYLEDEGRLIRTRGGAILSAQSTSLEIPYDIKRLRFVDEKRRIAAYAAELVKAGETIILDSGSTTYELAILLSRSRNLTVATNDLQSAVKLAANPNISVVCTGGIVRANVYTLLGSQTEAFLRTLRVNKTFLGADAIHRDGTIANVSLEEVGVKQAMIHAAEEVILIADSSKFQATAFARVCDLESVDVLITDLGISTETQAMLSNWRVQIKTV